ncbi:hypothetical protein [Bradyrhizobium sp. USDA 4350]
MTKLAGNVPRVIATIDLKCTEMLAWLYCPIKLPGQVFDTVPANLRQFADIVEKVFQDVYDNDSGKRWMDSYVYLTAKRLWVSPENPGNREGWHADGYGSADLNYIWADKSPTLFWEPSKLCEYVEDHKLSMQMMAHDVAMYPEFIRTYPVNTLLRLDETVIHAVAPCETAGWRTFVKVSVSDHRYLLEGNSINHELAPDWKYAARETERNCPLAPLKVGDGHYDKP